MPVSLRLLIGAGAAAAKLALAAVIAGVAVAGSLIALAVAAGHLRPAG